MTAALMHRTVKYLITFTHKCFALAAVATSAGLRAQNCTRKHTLDRCTESL